MAQQATTRPREAEKVQGPKTRAQQRRIVNREENTKGSAVPSPAESLKQAARLHPPRPDAPSCPPANRNAAPMIPARTTSSARSTA